MKKSEDSDFRNTAQPQTVYGPPRAWQEDRAEEQEETVLNAEEYAPEEDDIVVLYGPPPSRAKALLSSILHKIRRKRNEKK